MNEVDRSFDKFDEALNLDSKDRQAAIDLHHEIREILAKADVCGDAILQGSFARKTMLAPLRDIDMIGFLNAKHRPLMDKPGGVDEAMRRIEDALRPHFPTASFTRLRHAVKITFSDRDFTFDLVPAFDREGSSDIDIANHDDDSWDWSNTRELIKKVQQRNGDTDGRFVHQVRMLKHWARNTLEGISGLYVESAAYDGVSATMRHPEAVCAALRALKQGLETQTQYEPTRVENLYKKLGPDVAEAALPIIGDALRKAEEALELEAAGDDTASLDVWYSLFGDPFPKPPVRSVEDAFRNSLIGGLTSTGVATSSSAARIDTPPVRSWRP